MTFDPDSRHVGEARSLLGIDESADLAEIRAARRRLAKAWHPDAGGDDEAMQRLNSATDIAIGSLGRPGSTGDRRSSPGPSPAHGQPASGVRFDHDVASFTIEALPADAFEALLLVTAWIGELIVDDPPYQLDVMLAEPLRCWCRLDLVPDAGASTVALTIAGGPGEPLPDIDEVRDLWVASLNQLGPASTDDG